MPALSLSTDGLVERIYWLIRLRWIAIAGVVLTVLFTRQFLYLPIPFLPVYSIVIFLAIYNSAFLFYLNRANKESVSFPKKAVRIANAQISLDLLNLASLIHFSGGIENPFIFYFIFHMIISSILLSRGAAFLQATFAVLLFLLLVTGEYSGVITHYCLGELFVSSQHYNLVYIAGIFFVFMTTLYIAVYMTSSISKKLRQREDSLEEANELLRQNDRIKSEYVLRVTHDIKEHLSAIQSCIDPVSEGIIGALNEKQKDLLIRANKRIEKLTFFIKALLEITNIKLSKQIEMNYFSLKTSIDNALILVAPKAEHKNIRISSQIEISSDTLKGAQIYIEETIANLLINAVKYTPSGGKVALSVKDKGDLVEILISDTGIGIPEDDLPKIFEEFYRAKNARQIEKDGTGLGLSIAKQVIDRHNGNIWVESKLDKGSTFHIELPRSPR